MSRASPIHRDSQGSAIGMLPPHGAADQTGLDRMAASDQRAEFDSQLARAALDNADQKAQFEIQMAKAMLDMKVRKACPHAGDARPRLA